MTLSSGVQSWEAFSDGSASTMNCGAESGSGRVGNSLRLDFNISANGWGTCARFFDAPQDWSASEGLSFYFTAEQVGILFDIDLYAGSSENRETYLYTIEAPAESAEGWVLIRLRWDEFHRAVWEENADAPFAKANEVVGLAFGVNTLPDAPNVGSIRVDDIALLGGDAAPSVSPPDEPAVPEPTDQTDGSRRRGLNCGGAALVPFAAGGNCFLDSETEMKRVVPTILTLILAVLACTLGQPPASQTDPVPATVPVVVTKPSGAPPSGDVVATTDFEYLGAFRLPGGEEPPQTFAYGGNAMTFNPDGDLSGAQDGFPGTLFVTGHDRVAYGGVPDGDQVAEVSIPAPIISRNIEDLNTAEFVQDFADVTAKRFTELEEIPKVGLQYLNRPETGPKIHIAWGQHLQPQDVASHGWFNPTLSNPDFQGTWFIGNQDLYSVNGYMFEIPAAWADVYNGGRYLATGRMRDGGQGGMGPTIFAYRPWNAEGSSPPSGTRLDEVTLLLYENAYNTEEIVRAMNGYQHPDSWEGGAWITTSSGNQAVLFAGTKSNGDKYWYGYIHPDGPQYVCVDTNVTDFPTCRNADGSPCSQQDLGGCCDEEGGTCASLRGWWSTRFDAELILFDSNDLAKVASGQMESWEPQPYAVIDIDDYLYLDPPEWDVVELGWGDQRRNRIGDISYDRQSGLLYVLELYADGGRPVVHVWRVR